MGCCALGPWQMLGTNPKSLFWKLVQQPWGPGPLGLLQSYRHMVGACTIHSPTWPLQFVTLHHCWARAWSRSPS